MSEQLARGVAKLNEGAVRDLYSANCRSAELKRECNELREALEWVLGRLTVSEHHRLSEDDGSRYVAARNLLAVGKPAS